MTAPHTNELDRSCAAVSKEQLFELTLQMLIALVPELELHARHARNAAAKKATQARIKEIRDLIEAAREAA